MQKHVNLVDLVKSFPTNIFLQNLASIQRRTSPIKFAHLAEKSANGSISNLSTKVRAELEGKLSNLRLAVEIEVPPGDGCGGDRSAVRGQPSQDRLVVLEMSAQESLQRTDGGEVGSLEQDRWSLSAARTLVERFDIEPFPDFSAK